MTEQITITTELNMESDHNFYVGLSGNISEGGIFVATFSPKPVGAKVLIRFRLPGNHPVVARGVVEFIREENVLSGEDHRSGMGIKFTNLMKSDRAAINKYLARRVPEFFDA